MAVNQISVFVENKPGKLAEFTRILRSNHIDMRALSIAETMDFGILRVIVNDPAATKAVLEDAGYVVNETPVLALEVEDHPGALCAVFDELGKAGINLEYTYAFLARKADTAYLILRAQDNEKAAQVLAAKGVPLVSQEELAAL